jgi:nitroimidazol reductase NimA-like FMN-containing flavoprotein (pyridoxamine 5'-phosphate oxidase superfamily)
VVTFVPTAKGVRLDSVVVMTATSHPVSVLSETECWQLLSSVPLGRLVTSVDGHPEIFPINFAVQRKTILFRTAEGTKLVSTAINSRVLFEADQHDVGEGWSVIVKGFARVLRTDEQLAEAELADLQSWTAPTKQHFLRIRPLSVTGRRFVFSSHAHETADN